MSHATELSAPADLATPTAAPLTAQPSHDAPNDGGLSALLTQRPARTAAHALPEVLIGELIALSDGGQTALVTYPGQPGTAALRARSVLDLHAAHIGQSVVLSFERGDATLPIVMGVLRGAAQVPHEAAGQVQVDADGERLLISASEQLVLRCGQASITLTKAGKVLIEGRYVSSRSTGVNRLSGGSVQLN